MLLYRNDQSVWFAKVDPAFRGDVLNGLASRVRREKAALLQRVQAPPGTRSSRKQPEQAWR
jgi:hypothetical protein